MVLTVFVLSGVLDKIDATAGPLERTGSVPLTSAQWTFMVYLDGDNNLEGAGIDDFLEMATVGSSADVKIVVLFDRIPGEDNSYGNWTETRRGIINIGDIPDKSWGESMGELNMGDPQTLIDFVTWAMQNYPASKYAIVFWNHGGGWREEMAAKSPLLKAVCWDDSSGGDCLYMKEVRNALETIEMNAQEPNLVGFDACLMGMVEVAYEIREHASVMVGSEATEPWDGWPYDTLLWDLVAEPSMSPAELSSVIVSRYYESYGNDETQSAIDLTQIDALADDINSFAQTLRDDWNGNVGACVAAANSVMTAIDSAVILEEHGTFWPGSRGLAIYFPEFSFLFDSDYNGSVILFPKDTGWEEFLQDFYDFMTGSWVADVRAQSQEYDYPEHIDLYDFCEKVIENVPDDLSVEPQEDFTSTGDEGGPFTPRCRTYTLTNNGASPLSWTATANEFWLEVEPNGAVLSPGNSNDVNVCVNANADSLPTGVYSDTVTFLNLTSGIPNTRNVILQIGQIDYFTEMFEGDNDLDNLMVTLSPNVSASSYYVCTKAATAFPTDPTGGTVLSLFDDDDIEVTPTEAVWLYGTSYNSFYVGSNGYITFNSGDTEYTESLDSHFDRPRISGLFVDLDPNDGGVVSWRQLDDRLVVTYENVPEYDMFNSNSFQIEMFFDGTIRLTYLGLDATGGLAGLSEGNGVPVDFTESNLSAYPSCLVGDLEPDGDVDFVDFARFALRWMETDCGECSGADLTGDEKVEPDDLQEFVDNWLEGVE